MRRRHHFREANERNDSRRRVPHELQCVDDFAPRRPRRRHPVHRYARPRRVRAEVPRVQPDGLTERRATRQISMREPARCLVREDDPPRFRLREYDGRHDAVECRLEPLATARVARALDYALGHIDGEHDAAIDGTVCAQQRLADQRQISRLGLPRTAPIEGERLIHADVRLAALHDGRDLVNPLVQLGKDLRHRFAREIALAHRAPREQVEQLEPQRLPTLDGDQHGCGHQDDCKSRTWSQR